jgi:hypothetical protein
VEINELRYPFLYLWRREGVDTAAPGRWRGGAGINYAMVPHNSPFTTIAFLGSGKYTDRSQSLDGAYPPSLGDQGPAAIIRINGLREGFGKGEWPDNVGEIKEFLKAKGGEFKLVDPSQASIPVKEDEIIISLCGGGGGVGDPLDREPERVLKDIAGHIFSLEMARKVFGVVLDPETGTLDKKATEIDRERIRGRRKERGKIWKEGVYSDRVSSTLRFTEHSPDSAGPDVSLPPSTGHFRIHYYLDVDENKKIKCRKCKQIICDATENYKKYAPRAEISPSEVPGFRPVANQSFTMYYEYYCPCCFTLLDVEVAERGAPPLWDIQVKL